MMSGPSLETSALYVALYARASATANNYHWPLYHHLAEKAGTKFHIRNLGEGWIEGHEVTSGIQKEFLLMGFLKIGNKTDASRLRSLIMSVPYNTAGVTCRTWVLGALRNCIDAGLVRCISLDELESEAMAFGYSQFDDTVANVHPRPIIIATNSS